MKQLHLTTQAGISLIELVIFMTILGVIASGSILALQNVTKYASLPNFQLQAASLARSRMAIILQQRKQLGSAFFLTSSPATDPCSSGSPAICTELNTFATNHGLNATTTLAFNPAPSHILITVTISGQANYTLVNRVANYETF
jgi:type II secretory pathway pseudopilin PulG